MKLQHLKALALKCLLAAFLFGVSPIFASAVSNPVQDNHTQNADAQRVDLGKFVSTATTPVGLIIAGAIIISFFETKRVDSSGRVRALIAELRKPDLTGERKNTVTQQVNIYRRRLDSIKRGSRAIAATIIFFIITNLAASLGLVWPSKIFEVIVLCGMVLGMIALGVGMLEELYDSAHYDDELRCELEDFDRLTR